MIDSPASQGSQRSRPTGKDDRRYRCLQVGPLHGHHVEPKASANNPAINPFDMSTFLALVASLASRVACAVAAVVIKLTRLPEFVAVIVRQLEKVALLEAPDSLVVADVTDVLDVLATEVKVEDEDVESVVEVGWFA